MSTFLAGALAGFGVAVPLGAIGVLLVQEGITNGWRSAAAGGTGVALVDLAYAAVAVTAGSALTRLLEGRERAIELVGAAVLIAVVLHGLLGLRRSAGSTPVTGVPAESPWRVLRRFVVLTALNPLTGLYFVILTAGLGRRLADPSSAGAFVAGVFLASWAWQLVLAGISSATGSRLPGWARTVTSLVGYAVITGYAVRLAAG